MDSREPSLSANAKTAGCQPESLASAAGAVSPNWRCTRCGRDEIDARANGCERGPCPMEYVG